MRFKTFLSEGYEFTFEDAIKRIASECKPFLHHANGQAALRGISKLELRGADLVTTKTDKATFSQHPKSRSPRDSEPELNFAFNAMIDAAFHEENIRRRSVFITGKHHVASSYGHVNFAFPVGEIAYLWSPVVEDSMEDWTRIMHHLLGEGELDGIVPSGTFSKTNMLSRVFKQLNSVAKDAHTWIYDLDGKSAKMTREAFLSMVSKDVISKYSDDDLFQMLTTGMMNTAHDLYVDSRRLDEALKTGHEIMVYKSHGYYLIPVDLVYDEIVKQSGRRVSSRYDIEGLYKFVLDSLAGAQ